MVGGCNGYTFTFTPALYTTRSIKIAIDTNGACSTGCWGTNGWYTHTTKIRTQYRNYRNRAYVTASLTSIGTHRTSTEANALCINIGCKGECARYLQGYYAAGSTVPSLACKGTVDVGVGIAREGDQLYQTTNGIGLGGFGSQRNEVADDISNGHDFVVTSIAYVTGRVYIAISVGIGLVDGGALHLYHDGLVANGKTGGAAHGYLAVVSIYGRYSCIGVDGAGNVGLGLCCGYIGHGY